MLRETPSTAGRELDKAAPNRFWVAGNIFVMFWISTSAIGFEDSE
jgi:hypothetical protein